MYKYLIILFFALFQIASSAPMVFTFGCLRMGCKDVESAGVLAGFLATIQYANTYSLVPGVEFRLNVTTIPCMNYTGCSTVTKANNQYVRDFLAAMPGYSAILKPNFILSNTVVDEATRLGGIPVLDADDIRTASFMPGADHVIHFNHNWQRQLDHLFTYMMQTGRCAKTGILYGANNSEYFPHIASLQKLFTAGGYASPPSRFFTNMTDAQIRTFFAEPNQNCYVILGSNYFGSYVLYRLNTLGINPTLLNFYGVATLAGDEFVFAGSSKNYQNLKYVHWAPQFDSAILKKAFQEWLPNTAEYTQYFAVGRGESLPTAIVPFTQQGYLVMSFLIETIRSAVSRSSAPNMTGPLPLSWNHIVDEFYKEARVIDGYTFNALVRTCPRAPATQICYCNALTRTSYLYGVNTTSRLAFPVFDDFLLAQRGVTSVEFPNSCGYVASAWSYPITGLALYPSYLLSTGQQRTIEEEAYTMYRVGYAAETINVNFAATPPTRALRYAAYDISANETVDSALDKYIASLKPFVIYGSMTSTITNPRGILTLAANMMAGQLEEPVLVPHDQWRWDIVRLQPVLADYIHALAAYYKAQMSRRVRQPTSLHAIASTQREAELLSMSLATWGFDVPVATITVSTDPFVWADFARSWLGAGTSNPFVIAVTQQNNNSLVQSITAAAGPIGKGVLAVASSITNLYDAKPLISFSANGQGDIVFGAYRREWWTPDVLAQIIPQLQIYASNPRYHQAQLGMDVAKQLYQQVYYDYKTTAAQVLYSTSVISASETSFGPFSNATCSAEEIAANTRDRSCQCTKGVRRIFVHSMRNYQDGVASNLTRSYSWTMTTCGVVYSPYVAPAVERSSGLSTAAVAGIAVGASLAGLLVVGALVASRLLGGRNNRAAPKDASQPFAIVFTDIQSSTALWARAPAAMSEAVDQHHQLLRRALWRNGGYEVKTVGDSFMVAFKDPADAARFALDVQVVLHAADWSEELDATYLELIAEAEVVAATTVEEDTSTQSEGLSYNRRQSGKLLDAVSIAHSSASNQMAFQPRGGKVLSYASESPRQHESPAVLSEVHAPSVLVTHSRTPNQSALLSRTPGLDAHTTDAAEPSQQCSRDDDSDEQHWHGLRVRIGVHFGMGDIRKDPVSQGYDYYGTVVNTAARVEGVGHGGQTLLTDVVFEALPPGFAAREGAVLIALGPQPLRGLDAPIALYQMVPASLQGRRFPALRLHIEKETEESSVTETTTATGTTGSETADVLVARLCAGKQFASVAPEEVLDRYHYFAATFGPVTDKYKASVIAKLGESWGFEKAAKVVQAGGVGRTRLLVSLIAKVTKAYHSAHRGHGARRHHTITHTSHSQGNHHDTVSMSEAIKSIHQADMHSVSDGR